MIARAPAPAGIVLAALSAAPLVAQSTPASGPQDAGATIDSVAIEREDLFDRESASRNPFLRFFNEIHATTKPFVIRRELLLDVGQPFDSLLADESERNLRSLGLFRSVRVDTSTVGGRTTLFVRTKDAWSIQPRATARIASDGTLTGTFGITETNFGGTGNRLQVWYVRQSDRDGLVLASSVDRIGSSRVGLSASWAKLSDVESVNWAIANPFRSSTDRWSAFYGGEAFSGRVLQYRTEGPSVRDTTEWRRRALTNRGFLTFAPVANARRYVRIGASVEVRREDYLRVDNPALDVDSLLATVPDSVYGLLGGFVEYRRSRFTRVGRLNGFTEEDQDLSDLVFLSLKLASADLGYASTGIGTRLLVGTGTRAGPAIFKAVVDGNALFNSAGLDSGRVVGTGTIAVKSAPRHATLARLSGGLLESVRPGQEFDLGFEVLPRLWGPHAFVGTRSFRATVEHRFYAIDEILNIVGLGFAAFVDYGGAWYPDQPSRLGGDAGLSIFVGSPLSPLAQVAHVSGGYRFGGGIGGTDGARWVISLGSGIIF